MGLTYVRIHVSKRHKGPARPIRVLVDTGATSTMLPRVFLKGLGVRPQLRKTVRLGDGRLIERDLGIAHVRYRTHATPTWVLFGEAGDASVLGALTLEELFLQVDPRSRRLREIEVVPMIVAVPA